MTAEITNLLWHRAETVAAAPGALARGASVELRLPAGYHHAVYPRLGSAAQAGAAETLVVVGGARLLGRVAEFREDGGAVEAPAARARVRVLSPSPTITIVCARAAAERGA